MLRACRVLRSLLPSIVLTKHVENPFQAAQRFLHANELPLTYIDQVVKFIEQNTAGVSLGTSNEFVDPYTGSYLPFIITTLFHAQW
jgi:hypothetical protein